MVISLISYWSLSVWLIFIVRLYCRKTVDGECERKHAKKKKRGVRATRVPLFRNSRCSGPGPLFQADLRPWTRYLWTHRWLDEFMKLNLWTKGTRREENKKKEYTIKTCYNSCPQSSLQRPNAPTSIHFNILLFDTYVNCNKRRKIEMNRSLCMEKLAVF